MIIGSLGTRKRPLQPLTRRPLNSGSFARSGLYAEVQSVLPRLRHRTATQCARSICLVSKEPLSTLEIERRMRREDYSTRSQDFARYLRRLLRESEQFVEVARDVWSLEGSSGGVPRADDFEKAAPQTKVEPSSPEVYRCPRGVTPNGVTHATRKGIEEVRETAKARKGRNPAYCV
jgi:hypothetical protein